MSVQFQHVNKRFSETLSDVTNMMPDGKISVRQLLALVGEQGMLLFAMILTIPFLTPLPLPGISTVFGAIIMLISIGVILDRVPWLPEALMKRQMASTQLIPVLQRGAKLFHTIERVIRPRLLALTGGLFNRVNGVTLFIGGFLLILPLPVLPLSNFLPGWAILLLAAGIIQRDGLLVVIGNTLIAITTVYFGIVAILVITAGQSLTTLFNGFAPFLLEALPI